MTTTIEPPQPGALPQKFRCRGMCRALLTREHFGISKTLHGARSSICKACGQAIRAIAEQRRQVIAALEKEIERMSLDADDMHRLELACHDLVAEIECELQKPTGIVRVRPISAQRFVAAVREARERKGARQ